jgi:hypothetical protein
MPHEQIVILYRLRSNAAGHTGRQAPRQRADDEDARRAKRERQVRVRGGTGRRGKQVAEVALGFTI